jgi:hypothetical protein
LIEKDMANIKWVIGSLLYFLGIGLWFIVIFSLIGWGLVLLVPSAGIAWIIGWMSSGLVRKTEKWPWFRNLWLWEVIRTSYFAYTIHGPGAKLMKREMSEVKVAGVSGIAGGAPLNKLMWAVYPHGIFPWTAIFHWALNPRFKDTIPCMHGLVMKIPLIRDMAGWCGATSVSSDDMITALNTTGRVIMCPDGIAGMAMKGRELKKRRGFLRIAKETNTYVVPVWIPEERSYYRMWMPLGRTLEPWLRYPIPLFVWGMLLFPLMPRMIQTRIYVGSSIHMNATKSVEQGYIEFYQAIEDLQEQADKEAVAK